MLKLSRHTEKRQSARIVRAVVIARTDRCGNASMRGNSDGHKCGRVATSSRLVQPSGKLDHADPIF
jgi:hypothetical protein